MVEFIEHFYKHRHLIWVKLVIDVFFKALPTQFPMSLMLTLLEKIGFKSFYDMINTTVFQKK